MRPPPGRGLLPLTLVAGTLTGVSIASPPRGDVHISTLSVRADLVSGGDALVKVGMPDKADPGKLRLRLNGHDVTSSFRQHSDGHGLGLLTGLRLGHEPLTRSLA